jgi:hypothetical protein
MPNLANSEAKKVARLHTRERIVVPRKRGLTHSVLDKFRSRIELTSSKNLSAR